MNMEDTRMYLHIGNQKTLKTAEILGIFDLDTATKSPVTRKFLAMAQKRGETVNVSDDLPKSFLINAPAGNTAFQGKPTSQTVYLSQLAPQTLTQRMKS